MAIPTPKPTYKHLDVAREVLAQESAGLSHLRESLDETFNQAVDLLARTKGRVVISGMGKSGHVGRKIASTLSSTGQPALFVHPAEASHGDLGMITRHDTLLFLSNSGETAEMTTLINYAQRFSIPSVAITARAKSTLAQMATVCLLLPSTAEACPMGLAPTTSTTMMVALGDALAIALLTDRGFSDQDFHQFHPGGNLGSQLKRVSQVMHGGDKLPLVHPEGIMSEVLLVMTAKGFGCVGVVDEQNRLMGVVTDGDLRRHMSPELLCLKAVQVMTPNPKTINPSVLMGEALALLNEKRITSLFVVDESRCVLGLIHIHDFLRAGIM